MYRKYVLKRVLYGVLMYIVMIFMYSALFNNVADQTMRSQIEEQVRQEVSNGSRTSPRRRCTVSWRSSAARSKLNSTT